MESEKEKMGTGRLYDANYDTELIAERQACKELCYTLNHLPPSPLSVGCFARRKNVFCWNSLFIVTMAITLRLVKIFMPI